MSAPIPANRLRVSKETIDNDLHYAQQKVFGRILQSPKTLCHFLCLEIPIYIGTGAESNQTCLPAGRENSRKKVMLRTFFLAHAQVISLLIRSCLMIRYLLFKCSLTTPRNSTKIEAAAIGEYCRRCIFACVSSVDAFPPQAKNKALEDFLSFVFCSHERLYARGPPGHARKMRLVTHSA